MKPHSILFLSCCALAGCCGDQPVNPSFPLTMDKAEIVWEEMSKNQKSMKRPVLVLGGIADAGFSVDHVADKLAEVATEDSHFIDVSFLLVGSFDRCAEKVIKKVDEVFPTSDPTWTVEVDAIGYSMGGLVARYAASEMYAQESDDGRRLRLVRLFTVSTPHNGAKLANLPTFDSRVIDMRADSDFLAQLNTEDRDYELHCYARLGDAVVGEENAAPPGMTPWWLGKYRGFGHTGAWRDTRILADIARRLRSESPFTHEQTTPLPE